MKCKFLIIMMFLAFAQAAFAQNIVISSKKVIYKRSDNTTFTVNYPQIKTKNSILAKKIKNTMSYQKNFFFRLEDQMSDYKTLEEAEFAVGFNKKGVLCVALSLNDNDWRNSLSKNIVVDLKTGKSVKPADVFTNFRGLIAAIKKYQTAEIKESIEEIKNNPDFSGTETEELFKFADFKIINLEGFAINDDGVTFSYNYGFPRSLLTVQPSGNYLLSWEEMKSFIKRRGLLGKFVR